MNLIKTTKNKKYSATSLAILMFLSNILLIIIGFGIKKIQTLKLGDINYGEYAFFISLITFVSLFFRFGYFVSLQNLLSQNHNKIREKKLLEISQRINPNISLIEMAIIDIAYTIVFYGLGTEGESLVRRSLFG